MVLSAIKDICTGKLKSGTNLLDRMTSFRPKPDGLDFFTRPLISPEEAMCITPPSKVASFIKARQTNISLLAKMVLNNLSIAIIEPDEREKISGLAKCQYQKFLRIMQEQNCDVEYFHREFEKWGAVIESSKKELWTPMTLNTTGQVTNYELMLNGVQPAPAAANCATGPIDQNLAFGRSLFLCNFLCHIWKY